MHEHLNDVADLPLTYDLHLYSRNDALSIFLRSLSYHRVGAAYLANELARRSRRAIHRALDIGCGEGTFTSTLIREMQIVGVAGPQSIYAFDPDIENLTFYKSRLRGCNELALTTSNSTLERAQLDRSSDLVICSHSLYGMMENPSLTGTERVNQIRRILSSVAPDGLVFMSLASANSPAYEVKRDILRVLNLKNPSAHGEELQSYLILAGSGAKATYHSSYMDVTEILDDSSAMIKWCSYFCRVPENQLQMLGQDLLRKIINRHILQFRSATPELQKRMKEFPAALGSPADATVFLPHREIFFVTS
ncbi:hypothetical protein TSA1_19875 [Bradyrhizobium nitroreducens]|uniref:Methyltransferase domain-containing protein n=1 Tax=Bradyrhizobium nitroreducens TaxID=709803 RepID=A0A2M6UDX9_9BRAD|nr:methyltransferase domain-containing protein [Bradyrhizobium nitroreducens]PIT02758.1 hypothetical protein TSA1_19875 [Bradyrhizobium nitroreducens]